VLVAPSTQENAGKTAIEAMACGVPVVAFANTGQIDIVDHMDTGYLATDRSAEDLAHGIAWCLEQGQTDNRLSRQARAKVVRCFDNRAIAEQYIALYERCIARRHQPSSRRVTAAPLSRGVEMGPEKAAVRQKKESVS
jgi:glycosyltransferase involved in cell wall biosynthesis